MASSKFDFNIVAHCCTLPLISVLSSLTLALALSHAVAVTSYDTVLAHPALIFYSVTVPLASIGYTSLANVLQALRQIRRSVYGTLVDLGILSFGVLIAYGWIIVAGFWTHCEVSRTNRGVCPFEYEQGQVMPNFDAFRIPFAWMTGTATLFHCGFQARKIKEENIKRQQIEGQSKRCEQNVTAEETRFMARAGKIDDVLV
jgi:hypothetical protein